MADKTYNGWTNYETWAVKLWIDNEQGGYEYWREVTREVWASCQDAGTPGDAAYQLAERLKDEHDSQSEHPVFKAANGSVYADLLNAALAEVNWQEIAEALLDDGYDSLA